jgi:esterase/lipase
MKIILALLIILNIIACSADQKLSIGVKPFIKTRIKGEQIGSLSPCYGTTPSLKQFNHHQLFKYDPKELSQWMAPIIENRQQEKGVILIAHGLNLRPSKMNTLAHSFSAHGYHILRLSLSGHRGNLNEMKLVNRNIWLSEMKAHYCLALKKSKILGLPLYFLGYSLGAAVLLDLLKSRDLKNNFQKIITISPAIRVHWYTHLPKLLAFFSKEIVIPSFNNKQYRMHKGTTTAAYEALHTIIDNFDYPHKRKLKVPIMVVIDPKDELVSFSQIQSMIKKNKLSNWQITQVNNNESSLDKKYHHLIIDPPSLGKANFIQLQDKMLNFLNH